MDRVLRLTVENDCTVRDFLRARFSGRRIHFLREKGNILLSGRPVTAADRARKGETLELVFKETQTFDYAPEELGVGIIYEDEDVLVAFKPQGIPSMPAAPHFTGTLYNALAYLRPGEVFRIATRLDKDTSGLVLLLKNALSHSILFEEGAQKTYSALARGRLTAPLVIDAPVYSDGGRKRYVDERGKPAKTRIIAAEPAGENTFLTIATDTGRTHQIRVHLAHIGHPLVGDELYGGGEGGQKLCCTSLAFVHPLGREKMTFSLCISPDFDLAEGYGNKFHNKFTKNAEFPSKNN